MKRLSRIVALALPCVMGLPAIGQSFEEVPVIQPAESEDLVIDVASRTLDPSRANVRLDDVELQPARRAVSAARAEIESSRLGLDVAKLELGVERQLDPADPALELYTGASVGARGAKGIRTEFRAEQTYDRLTRLREGRIVKPEPAVADGAYVVD